VINCPPFADRSDIAINVASSLMMPSSTPAMTVIKPQNAAHAAIRALNVSRLRRITSAQIRDLKEALLHADCAIRKE